MAHLTGPGRVGGAFLMNDRLRSLASEGSSRKGFSLLEIFVSMAILTFGLLTLLQILNRTLIQSEPIEFETRAALLAQTMLEGIRSDPTGYPFLPGLNPTTWPVVQENSIYGAEETLLADENGDPFDLFRKVNNSHRWNLPLVFTIPGNGVDDDAFEASNRGRGMQINGPWTDRRTSNEKRGTPDGIDDFMYDQLRRAGIAPGVSSKRDFDGGIESDVSQSFLRGTGVDNRDTDGDGLFEDTGDSSSLNPGLRRVLENLSLRPDGDLTYDPQRGIDEEIANGIDDDADGLTDEDLALPSQRLLNAEIDGPFNPFNPYHYAPHRAGNGIDDDLDGQTDEEIFDTLDNDADGSIDEDCRGAVFPWRPAPLPPPNDDYNFQLSVRRVPIGGTVVPQDDDNDGKTDEEFLNGVDDDGDSLTDEDVRPYGDLMDNDGDGRIDEEYFNNLDDDGDGFTDEDIRTYSGRNKIFVTITIQQGEDRQDNDGDGWIDEEANDAIDNDLDGIVDEDVFKREFRTTALVQIPEERP